MVVCTVAVFNSTYRWWSLWTLYLLVDQLTVTVSDSGLRSSGSFSSAVSSKLHGTVSVYIKPFHFSRVADCFAVSL